METRYFVEVKEAEKPLKYDAAVAETIKGVVKGKMLARMKREYVECPLASEKVAFLTCFVCVSHIRRVRGIVHCAGIEKKVRS
ncbi:hypothetical protein HRbin01_01167 [archaeon HR01]|nr:hypothetical protein HRbin01_01167 [archaeon HR01]